MSDIKYCNVKNCRFASFHITNRHKCGKCSLLGHGQIECGNTKMKQDLQISFCDNIPKNIMCKIKNCIDPNTHTTEGHNCVYCSKQNGHFD